MKLYHIILTISILLFANIAASSDIEWGDEWFDSLKTVNLEDYRNALLRQQPETDIPAKNADDSTTSKPVSSNYEDQNIKGWTVRVFEDLSKRKIRYKRAMKTLTIQLALIRSRVPSNVLQKIQQIPIWMFYRYEGPEDAVAYYHPDFKAVVFFSAKKLINMGDYKNAIVLHELAHGYHDMFLGFEHQKIIDTYDKAVKRGRYKNVINIYSDKRFDAYALENHMEYFAELTESYFSGRSGKFSNDFYPFNKSQLKKYDKFGYRLMKEIWN